MKKILLFLSFLALTSSCKKDASLVSATVINAGDPNVDGCGWLIETADKRYHANNLDSKFEVDHLAVSIAFEETTDSFACGDGPISMSIIHITKIKKQ